MWSKTLIDPMAFPDPLSYDYPKWVQIGSFVYRSNDVVAYGTPLTVGTVREAYRKGIFPWYTEGIPLPWHCPDHRAVLDFAELSVPRSLAKEQRKAELTFTFDNAFEAVIRECSRAYRPGQGGTWITPDFKRVYSELHQQGDAHSVEAWDKSGNLVGGLYGIDAGGVFCGESMFYKAPNASKLALLFLIGYLQKHGSTWLDCQVMTPHMEMLGAKEINRHDFLHRLAREQNRGVKLFSEETKK